MMEYELTDQKTDYLKKISATNEVFKQPVSALQLDVGLQKRLGRWYKHRKTAK